ncbi:MAG TPA: glycosyltransferase family 1 protein [Pyrinomonadaceae bacterium]
MRIGIDGIPLASARTGIGHYTFELAQALARLAPEHEFQLVSPVPFISGPPEPDGVAPSNLHKVQTKRRFWWGLGLPGYITQSSLSLFHGTNYEVPLWSKCPSIVTVHDLSLLLHPEMHSSHLVRRARYRLPLMARAANTIIAVTESASKEISDHLRINPAKIAVTPLAPRRTFRPLPPKQTEETRKRLGVEDDFILFVGTPEPRKNLITLLRALTEVRRNTELRPQLVIAGKRGWHLNEILAEIASAGLTERLKFTDYISDGDLCALYSSCTVCIYPSLYEGFGLPPLEAMACGAPVITSNIPSIVETTGNAAHLISPNDVQQLAQAIVEMIAEAGKRLRLSRAGLERASQFTWERTAELTLEVYKETLRSWHRPIQ